MSIVQQACGLCGGVGCGTVNGTGGEAFCCPSTIRENGEVRAKIGMKDRVVCMHVNVGEMWEGLIDLLCGD